MFDIVNITGFQAFGDVSLNPTELIVNNLKENPHPKLRRIQKLNVTVKDVDTYVHYLSVSCSAKEGQILNLHLGVGPNKVYHLETCAYNNKDFRIPDNNGYQCSNQKINTNLKLDEPLNTKIDLNWVREELKKKGHQSLLSTDPGRYLCNYIYYNSLSKVSNKNCASLFVHIPPLSIKKPEQNIRFITDLIDVLTKK